MEKNETLPFSVETSEMIVTALGTEFNMRSYPDENSIQVILTEGKVMAGIIDDKKIRMNT